MAEVLTIPDYPRGLTFEKVWASIQELRESQKETGRLIEETWRQIRENDRQMNKRMGSLYNRFGEFAEHLVAPGIMEKFQKMGFAITRWSNNVKIFDADGSVCLAEIDILLENGDIAVAVEVKAKPDIDDVKEHIERMEKLRLRADRVNEKYKYVGVIAGAIITEDVRRSILKSGFYVVEQAGDTMKISVPQGFVPRKW